MQYRVELSADTPVRTELIIEAESATMAKRIALELVTHTQEAVWRSDSDGTIHDPFVRTVWRNEEIKE